MSNVAAVAPVQEEVTMAGSRTSAFNLTPTVAVVVDVTHATDAPGIDVKSSGPHALGSGPVLTRGAILHIGYDDKYMYLAYDVRQLGPIKNSGEQWDRLFKTGGAVDLQIGIDPNAPRDLDIQRTWIFTPVGIRCRCTTGQRSY